MFSASIDTLQVVSGRNREYKPKSTGPLGGHAVPARWITVNNRLANVIL